MSKLFKKLDSLLGKLGDSIDSKADTFLEGAMESAKYSVKLVDNLVFNGSGKTLDIIELISIRHSIVKALYPTNDLEGKLKINPKDKALLIDLFDIKERQFTFSMKLLKLLNLTPFSKDMSSKSANFISEQREEENAKNMRQAEMKLILEEISQKIDEALSSGDTTNLEVLITPLIKTKILINDLENMDSWLDISKEIISEKDYSHLTGRYFLAINDYEKAFLALEKAYNLKSPYAEDDLALCLDKLVEVDPTWKKKRSEIFPNVLGSEFLSRVSSMPLSFLNIKINQIHKIFKQEKENEKAS